MAIDAFEDLENEMSYSDPWNSLDWIQEDDKGFFEVLPGMDKKHYFTTNEVLSFLLEQATKNWRHQFPTATYKVDDLTMDDETREELKEGKK